MSCFIRLNEDKDAEISVSKDTNGRYHVLILPKMGPSVTEDGEFLCNALPPILALTLDEEQFNVLRTGMNSIC